MYVIEALRRDDTRVSLRYRSEEIALSDARAFRDEDGYIVALYAPDGGLIAF